jgi:hypothetical protein
MYREPTGYMEERTDKILLYTNAVVADFVELSDVEGVGIIGLDENVLVPAAVSLPVLCRALLFTELTAVVTNAVFAAFFVESPELLFGTVIVLKALVPVHVLLSGRRANPGCQYVWDESVTGSFAVDDGPVFFLA